MAMKMRLRLPLGVAACLLWALACSGCSSERLLDVASGDSDLPGDVPEAEAPGDTVVDGFDSACPPNLGYVDPMDDPNDGYHIELPFNTPLQMRAKVTSCTAAVVGLEMTFQKVEDADNLCALDHGSALTDENGIASVVVESPQESMTGGCRFQACISGTGICIPFNVLVNGKVKIPLTVAFADYVGAYPLLSQGKIKLFKKSAATPYQCASLKADALPSATMGMGPLDIHTAAKFDTLPYLDTDLTQTYTIFCTATETSAPDVPKAYGCVDDVVVYWGGKRFVECPLNDIPTRIVGSYDITTTLDMVSGLPPQVALVVNYIIDFLDSPTGAILKLMCDLQLWGTIDSALQQLCAATFIDVNNPQIDHLTPLGLILRGILDANVKALLESQCPDKANPTTCTDVIFWEVSPSDSLRKLKLLSTMTCTHEPDPDGLIALGGCTEKWHSVVFHWTFFKNCDPSDPTCGDVQLSLASMPGLTGTITTAIEARLAAANTGLAITRHPVGLQYGHLLDFVVERLLLTQVYGDGADGTPPVDSFETLLEAVMAGKACLAAQTCCHDFAANLVAQSGGAVDATLAEAACNQLITAGGAYIRGFLTGLDTTTSNFELGTPVADGTKYLADQPCAILDKNQDMKFDALGGQPADQQCVWDVTLTLGGFDYHPDATFYGSRQ